MDTPLYRGRFAPSPTGPLHFGSLVAAVGSFLDARAHGGEWLVRIDDLDLPRCVPGMADDILRILEAFGLEWDGAVVYQSHRSEYYRAALAELEHLGAVYPCACTRREIADSALGPDGAAIYPGTCRGGLAPGRSARAIRLRVDEGEVGFQDELQGWIGQHLANEVGDFVIRRADGLFAYQLATVVDDAEQGVTCVVRGSDLIDSTPRQIALQRLLELPVPAYAHLPVAVNAQGEKLSKQTLAPPVSADKPVLVLRNVLRFLGQELPKEAQDADLAALWRLAASHWRRTAIPP
ncbi:MAG: tRNA glutamyl-Q(34) synthetase GluQRS, partial [Sulfuricella sp.]|nr:tRNA glutamyl-Q(34) synthetase GluQRS [Sulfuricella sp.]